MSPSATRTLAVGVVVIALLVAIMAAQALAAFSAPPGATVSTGVTLGQTGFEYLGGLRKFAAAALWNRLEPQFHEYGNGKSIDQRLDFLPTMRLVQMLDPQFEQAYYVSAFMLSRIGRMPQALQIAREGIEKNPNSGLMRANYAQILLIQDEVKNLPEALKQAKAGTVPGTKWANSEDQFEGYGIFRTVFKLAGDEAAARKMTQAQKSLSVQDAGIGVERDK
jgi:tetratricopeptide (TPR) repeat protein